MNKQRRKYLQHTLITLAGVESMIDILLSEEEQALENMPDPLKETKQGDASREAINYMQYALAGISEAQGLLASASQL